MKKSGELLKDFRLNRGVTLEQLALSIGYSKSYLSRLESCDRPLTDEVMYPILKCLQASKVEIATIKEAVIHESPALSVALVDLKPHQKDLAIKLIPLIPKLSTVKCEKLKEILC